MSDKKWRVYVVNESGAQSAALPPMSYEEALDRAQKMNADTTERVAFVKPYTPRPVNLSDIVQGLAFSDGVLARHLNHIEHAKLAKKPLEKLLAGGTLSLAERNTLMTYHISMEGF